MIQQGVGAHDVRSIPLSFAQQRLWFHYTLDPENAYYNIPYVFSVRSPLDADTLELAAQQVIGRHETLRTLFDVVDGQPKQIIKSHVPFAIERIKIPAHAHSDDVIRELSRRPFVLEKGPLLRMALIDSGDRQLLFLCMHHIISDFTSCKLFLKELGACYDAIVESATTSAVTPLHIQYADYTRWHNAWLSSNDAKSQLQEWREHLEGAAPVLDLTLAAARPAVQQFSGAMCTWQIPGSSIEPIRAIAKAERSTLFMAMLSMFALLLGRHAERDDVVVATAPSGRTVLEYEGVIGFFVNTLPLRIRLTQDGSFRDLLRTVRSVSAEALARADVPFDLIVRELCPDRSLSYNPVAQVAFVLHHVAGLSLEIGGQHLTALEFDNLTSKFDMTMCIFDCDDHLECILQYDESLFSKDTAEKLIRDYNRLLEQIVAAGCDISLTALHVDRLLPQHAPKVPSGSADREEKPHSTSDGKDVRETIRQCWTKLLEVKWIDDDADFFKSGGHSLLAARAAFELSQTLHVRVPVRVMFEHKTISTLARHLASQITQANG